MNSLKTMAKMEDEVGIIASIYVASIKYCFANTQCLQNKTPVLYIHRVDEALRLIGERHRQVIQNDFIFRKSQWWKSIYSTKLYLAIRQVAVGSFLMHFYES